MQGSTSLQPSCLCGSPVQTHGASSQIAANLPSARSRRAGPQLPQLAHVFVKMSQTQTACMFKIDWTLSSHHQSPQKMGCQQQSPLATAVRNRTLPDIPLFDIIWRSKPLVLIIWSIWYYWTPLIVWYYLTVKTIGLLIDFPLKHQSIHPATSSPRLRLGSATRRPTCSRRSNGYCPTLQRAVKMAKMC